MTTTEPRPRLTALEWRLYIVAAIASVYVVSWRVLDRPVAPASTEPPPPPATPVAVVPAVQATPPVRPQTARPLATRPQTVRPQTARPQPPRIIRVVKKRRPRTRSS